MSFQMLFERSMNHPFFMMNCFDITVCLSTILQKMGVELEGGLEDSWEGGFDLVGVFSSDDPFYTALLLFKGIRHPYGVGVVQQNVVIKESGGDVLPFRFIEEDMAFHLCEVLMMYLNE